MKGRQDARASAQYHARHPRILTLSLSLSLLSVRRDASPFFFTESLPSPHSPDRPEKFPLTLENTIPSSFLLLLLLCRIPSALENNTLSPSLLVTSFDGFVYFFFFFFLSFGFTHELFHRVGSSWSKRRRRRRIRSRLCIIGGYDNR